MVQIEIKNLSFGYNGGLVLKNISHQFNSGNLISIVGPNGSGKSTLIKCLDGLLKYKIGEIKLGGLELSSMSPEKIAKIIAYVPQSESNTFPSTVFDTILIGRKPHISWAPAKHDLEIVSEVMQLLDLSKISLKPINKLSGGQRQRVFIARALAQEPKILFLDEPTANLDLKHQLEVLKILKDLSYQGITVVIAIHDLNLALQYSDKFVLLKEGEIFATGGKEIISNKNIEKLYDIKVKIIKDDDHFIIVPQK